jgi:hypothetical protein
MGYLNNGVITVDAILTKKGRELLAQGRGNFNITQFALSDDEIDYDLWNPSHPEGSDYFGAVIENMPITEAIPDETQSMKYKLITLEKSTVAIPYIEFKSPGGTSLTIRYSTQPPTGTVIEFQTKQYTGQIGSTELENQTYSATILDTTYMDIAPVNTGTTTQSPRESRSGNSRTLSGLSTDTSTKSVRIAVTGKAIQDIISGQSKSTKLIITNELYGSRFVLPITYTS